jgi:hypothetical protein
LRKVVRWLADVARSALRVLARGAAGLSPEQVVRVLLQMARAGMSTELNDFVAVLAAPGARKSPEVVALAAALAQDPAVVQQTLEASGAPPTLGHGCQIGTIWQPCPVLHVK